MKPITLFALLGISVISGCNEETVASFLTTNYDRCNYINGQSHASPDRTYFMCWKEGKKVFGEYYKQPTS